MNNQAELDARRHQWERRPEENFAFSKDDYMLLVVREIPVMYAEPMYDCIRYFQIGTLWNVSVDRSRVSGSVMLHWLEDNLAPDPDPSERP